MPDTFLHLPTSFTSRPTQPSRPHSLTLLYFVPGNPGLIEYYIPFLSLIVNPSTTWNGDNKNIVVAGASLGGFEASVPYSSPSQATSSPSRPESNEQVEEDFFPLYPPSFTQRQTGTYNLRDQIDLTHARLTTLVERLHRRHSSLYPDNTTPLKIQVILAGHSVGAYIALEVVQNHHEQSANSTSPSFHILSTLLLTPTIANIAHSPSGRIATPLLSYLPFLPTILQLGSSGLTGTLPTSWLRVIVRRVTGMKDEGMLDVTIGFLGRRGAVRQALDLAGWEMKEIGEGTWNDAVWGASEVQTEVVEGKDGIAKTGWRAPIHYLLFAREDHWVADETRETIVRRMGGRARITVDEGDLGLVHAWCLEQSELVAGIVCEWIEDTLFGRK